MRGLNTLDAKTQPRSQAVSTRLLNCQVELIVHFAAVEKPNRISDFGPFTARMITVFMK